MLKVSNIFAQFAQFLLNKIIDPVLLVLRSKQSPSFIALGFLIRKHFQFYTQYLIVVYPSLNCLNINMFRAQCICKIKKKYYYRCIFTYHYINLRINRKPDEMCFLMQKLELSSLPYMSNVYVSYIRARLPFVHILEYICLFTHTYTQIPLHICDTLQHDLKLYMYI